MEALIQPAGQCAKIYTCRRDHSDWLQQSPEGPRLVVHDDGPGIPSGKVRPARAGGLAVEHLTDLSR